MFVVLLWNKKESFLPDNLLGFVQDSFVNLGKGNGFPYKLVSEKISKNNFKVLDGDVIAVSDTSFLSLNQTAKELANRQHSFSLPTMRYSGSKILIYNLCGNGYQIESRSKSIAKRNTENNILSGAIANDGTYGFITESSGYFCEMVIYAKNGVDKRYKFYFSEYYMTKMDFSSNGKRVAVIGSSAENGRIKSVLYVFQYDKSEPVLKLEFPGEALLDVAYLSNGCIAIIGDNMASIVDTRNGKRKDHSYDDKTLTAFEINKDDGMIFSLSPSNDGNMCRVYRVDDGGKQVCDIEVGVDVSDISYRSGNISILSGDKIIKYDLSGKKCSEIEVGNDAKGIEMFSSNGVYVLCTGEIRKINL